MSNSEADCVEKKSETSKNSWTLKKGSVASVGKPGENSVFNELCGVITDGGILCKASRRVTITNDDSNIVRSLSKTRYRKCELGLDPKE